MKISPYKREKLYKVNRALTGILPGCFTFAKVAVFILCLSIIAYPFLVITPPVFAEESIVLVPTYGLPGTSISVTGSGFDAGRDGYIWFDTNDNDVRDIGEPQVSLTSNPDGAISDSITVPMTVSGGIHSVKVDLEAGGECPDAEENFTVTSRIGLNPVTGFSDTVIGVAGYGFPASASGYVWFDTDNDGVRDGGESQTAITVSPVGFIPVGSTLTVPTLTAGTYQVRADIPNDGTADSSADFTYGSSVALTPVAGAGGIVITISGGGFGSASATDTRVPTGDDDISGFSKTTTSYYEAVDEMVPNDSDYITGDNNKGGHAVFTFPAFSVPSDATVNSLTIYYRTQDSSSGDNNINATIKVGGSLYDEGSTTDPGSSFETYSYSYTTNPATLSAWTVDDINGTGANPLQAFGVTGTDFNPAILVSMVSIEVEYTTGWIWFDTDNDGTRDGGEPQVAVTPDSTGAIPAGTTLTMPTGIAAGPYPVYVDLPGGTPVEQSAKFLITDASITVNPTSGNSTVNPSVSGSGFIPNIYVYLFFDLNGNGVRDLADPYEYQTSIKADSGGNFSNKSMTLIPSLVAAGPFQIVATSGVRRAAATFTVTARTYIAPSSGLPDTDITFAYLQNTGFGPEATGYVWFDSDKDSIMDDDEPQTLVTIPTNSGYPFPPGAGRFPNGIWLTVPEVISDTYQVRWDIPADGVLEGSTSFIIPPMISLDPPTGIMDTATDITITGSGFDPNTAGVIWFDANTNYMKDTGEPEVAVTTTATGAIPLDTVLTTPLLPPNETYFIRADIPSGSPIEAQATYKTVTTTTALNVTKYDAYGSVISTQKVTWGYMKDNMTVYGDGSTHYYCQGPTFDESTRDLLWDPTELVNVDSRDYGAAKGTDVKDLCDLVGGASPGYTIQIQASDGFYKWFDYDDIYNPEPEQGKMIVTWYTVDTVEPPWGYVPDYGTGMRLLFFAETLNPDSKYVFGLWDMHEYLPPNRWHYYSDGKLWPSSSGLSVKYVYNINVYEPNVISCDASGTLKNEFAPDETVYVKGKGLAASTGYKLWIQDEPVLLSPLNALDRPSGTYTLDVGNDPSGTQETVTTDGSGDFSPTAIWTIPSGASAHNYDIVADNQTAGTVGTYDNSDGIDCPGWQGFSVTAISEVISFTVTDYNNDGINFGSLDPGDDDQPADGQPSHSAVTITVGEETNVDVDVWIKGENFGGAGTIPVGNVAYNDENNSAEASPLPSDYTKWYTVTQPLSEDDVTPVYYWISIDDEQTAGLYTSNFYYEAIKAE